MDRKVKLGIVGVGNMGTSHIKNIMTGKCPEIELTAVADVLPERLEWAKSVCPTVNCYASAEELFDSGKAEAVLIAVPHYFHPPYAIECMKRGLHVITEKPAGVYGLQVLEMMKVADEHPELVFGIMMNQRTNCVYRKMREIVKSGEMGEIRRTNWIITDWYRPQAYYNSSEWRATWAGEGGGVLLNQCPHNLDLWQWICGMPKKLTAKMYFGKWHDIEVEDDVTAFVEYENGATGVFIATTGDVPGTNRFEISLDRGKLLVENKKLYMWKASMTEQEWSATNTEQIYGKPPIEYSEVETDGQNPKHPGVLNAFAGAILRGEPLVADGREGINGLTISNALHLSAWLGKEVTLPLDHELFYSELQKRVATSRHKDPVAHVVANTEGTYSS